MKFSYRVAGLILIAVIALVLYISSWFYGGHLGSMLWGVRPEVKRRRIESHLWPMGVSNAGEYYGPLAGQSISANMQCAFGEKGPAPADIRSWEVLEKVHADSLHFSRPRHAGGIRATWDEGGSKRDTEPDPATEAKTRERPLKVIVIPHSHSDPGWHKTVDGYFADQTKLTLDNMVEKLLKFPKMTFIWAESVFLSLWWQDLEDTKRAAVRQLIAEKRLEVVVGSWVVPDEANPHYYALVDQMVEGHHWLWNNMAIKPNNTWALDPFGYSGTLPYLYKRAGYQNMVVLRVHEHVKEKLIEKKALEFWWRQTWDQTGSNDIRTQMMPYKLYNIKHTCGPDHHICLLFDFRKIPGEVSESRAEPVTAANVDRLSKILLGQYHKKAKLFKHNVVLVPLGDDFRYDRNIEWDQQYKNYMMLFNYMNKKPEWNVQARFGTLQDYFNELDNEIKLDPQLSFPVLEGDFFPYTDEHNDFWTGYFTSRPYDKALGRELESHLKTADMMNALAVATSLTKKTSFVHLETNLQLLERAHQSLGLFQHHDAITGTARGYVVIDYENRLVEALNNAQKVMASSAQFLLSGSSSPQSPVLTLDVDDPYMMRSVTSNRKVLHVSATGSDVVFVNSLAQPRHQLVHVLVTADTVEVIDTDGNIIPSQTAPVWKTMEVSNTEFEVVFYVSLPAMGMRTYKIRATPRDAGRNNHASVVRLHNTRDYRVPHNIRFKMLPPGGELIVLENEEYRLRFSVRTGLMHSITTKRKIQTTKLNMQLLMYKSRGSGAYIFYPMGPATDTEMSIRPAIRVVKGPLMSEIHVKQKMAYTVIRLYHTDKAQGQAIAIEHVVDIRDYNDKELVMRMGTDIQSNSTFYTDSNGYQMVKRRRFPRFPIQANYYPMTSMAYLQDSTTRLSILTAQPLGVTSFEDGGLEVMLDRRLTYDDGRGLGEGVLDNKPTPSRFYLIVERLQPAPNTVSDSVHRPPVQHNPDIKLSMPSLAASLHTDQLNYPIFILFPQNHTEVTKRVYSPMVGGLPCDIRMLSIRALRDSSVGAPPHILLILHRLGFDCAYPAEGFLCSLGARTFSLNQIFKELKITHAKETTLSLMHDKHDIPLDAFLRLDPFELYTYRLNFQ